VCHCTTIAYNTIVSVANIFRFDINTSRSDKVSGGYEFFGRAKRDQAPPATAWSRSAAKGDQAPPATAWSPSYSVWHRARQGNIQGWVELIGYVPYC